MEIDITSLVTDGETWYLTGSVATHGPCVARQTWSNAMTAAADAPLLDTEEKLEAMRAWVKSSGGWDEAERDAMTDQELNALFLQLVTQDLREMGLEDCEPEDFDWEEYQAEAEQGRISGNIYRGDIEGSDGFGRIFYSLEG